MTVSSVFSKVAKRRIAERKNRKSLWPDNYTNILTGKTYVPQNDHVSFFVFNDKPRYMLLKGGEGGGKSAAGIIKDLNRLKRGMSGIMTSPDLEHFKKSLWPAFKSWCPWQCVIERHKYRKTEGWLPSSAFELIFKNELGGYSTLYCGGAVETDMGGWEGPNVSFVHMDEPRRYKTSGPLKTFDGRARIPGPNGEPSQLFLTTTPRKHWLYEYFGGAQGDEKTLELMPEDIQVKYADFRAAAFTGTVLTSENEAAGNLEVGFTSMRAQSLDAAEARILLGAEWEDESDIEKFVNIIWWDSCREELPPLGRSEPIIIGLDAAKGGETNVPDCFAVIAISRHPNRNEDTAIRYCGIWQPSPGQLLDFAPIEIEIIRLCKEFSVVEVAYDPYQLHDMAMRLKSAGIANFKEFKQGIDRLKSDKQLQDLIIGRRIAHDGNPLLRQHIDNANIKKAGQDGIRLIKRSASLKIDAAVCASMAASRILYYNL
jgi:hypothetical protein